MSDPFGNPFDLDDNYKVQLGDAQPMENNDQYDITSNEGGIGERQGSNPQFPPIDEQSKLSQKEDKLNQSEGNKNKSPGMIAKACPCCTLDFYGQFFDVTTADIKARLIRSLVPFSTKFYELF